MYEVKNYDNLLGIKGLSETILKNHFALYRGYVENTNKLYEIIKNLAKDDKSNTPEYAELKRRFGWEFNGMRLHELYFDSMSKDAEKLPEDSKLFQKIIAEFSSYENWEKDFRANAAMRGIGWVILYEDTLTGRLFNVWVNEHDVGHLAGGKLILVMDVFEHAYMIDYGIKKVDYIDAFMKLIYFKN